MTTKEYYTRAEVEQILKIGSTRVKQLIADGRLTAVKEKGKWLISSQSLKKLKEKRVGSVTSDCRQTDGRADDTLKILLDEKDSQISYLQSQIKILQEEKKQLVNTFSDESLRKDIILKQAVENINKYKQINENITRAIQYNQTKTIDLVNTGKKRIAIIEDDTDTAELLKINLEKKFDVFIFNDVQEAAKYYLKNAFHLTLLDLNLNDNISGEQFINLIKKYTSLSKVIIISGESENRIKKAVSNTNAAYYFKKPLSPAEVTKKVNEII